MLSHDCPAGCSFAETALFYSKCSGLIYSEKVGYEEGVMRHNNPEDLFHHILRLQALTKSKEIRDSFEDDECKTFN